MRLSWLILFKNARYLLMQLPNKLFSYEESTFSKFPIILNLLENTPMTAKNLYFETKASFVSVSDFFETLDSLYALNKIDYNNKKEVIYFVD